VGTGSKRASWYPGAGDKGQAFVWPVGTGSKRASWCPETGERDKLSCDWRVQGTNPEGAEGEPHSIQKVLFHNSFYSTYI